MSVPILFAITTATEPIQNLPLRSGIQNLASSSIGWSIKRSRIAEVPEIEFLG